MNRCQFVQDFVSSFGPEERFGVLVSCFQVSIDCIDEVQGAVKDPSTKSLLCQPGKESFHGVQPGGRSWNEVEVKPRMPGQPSAAACLERPLGPCLTFFPLSGGALGLAAHHQYY